MEHNSSFLLVFCTVDSYRLMFVRLQTHYHTVYSKKFSLFGSRALSKNCHRSRFNARKPHSPIPLYVKYRCVGVYPGFNVHVTALPSKNAKFCTPRKFPVIYGTCFLWCDHVRVVLHVLRKVLKGTSQ